MDKSLYDKKVEIFKALSNPVRLEIVDLLLNGEMCVCEITERLDCGQSHISKNLAKLREAGLIKDRKEGLNVYYSLRIGCMAEFFGCLNSILAENSGGECHTCQKAD